jgi:hypothetical protein
LDAGKARAAMDARYGADRIDVIQTPFMTQQ